MTRIGPYDVVRELGRGAMGVVYHARHAELGREVALKLLQGSGEATPEALERFRREARAAARLAGIEGLVGVHAVGDADGVPWIAMDFVKGLSLDAVIDEGELSPLDCARMLARIARAVERAHAEGILHRDLKPANILVDAEGRPWVTDFGLARSTQADADATRLTHSQEIVGTPAYMPPEQALGKSLDARADVYALGATLYEMLTEAPPFMADSIHGVLAQVLRQPPRPMASIRGGVPRDLETIVRCCLEKHPDDRYTSAAALADDVERFLAGNAIAARPPSALQRLGRAVARRRVVVLSALLLGAAAGAAAWWTQRTARVTADTEGGISAVAGEVERAELAQQLSSAYHTLSLETAEPMAVLTASFGGVTVPVPERDAAIAAVREVTGRLSAAQPDAALPAAWYGLALHFAGDPGAAAALQAARERAGRDPFPALLSALADYATYVRDLQLPSAVIGSQKTTLESYQEEPAQLALRQSAARHLQGLRDNPLWARLSRGGELVRLAAGVDALAAERHRDASAALQDLQDAPLFGPAAAALRGLALVLSERPAEAAADWERAEAKGWAICADHAAMGWLAAGTLEVGAERDPVPYWTRAVAAIGRSIEREPAAWKHFHLRGIVHMQLARAAGRRGEDPRPLHRDAERDFLHVVELGAANVTSLNALGVTRRELGFAEHKRGGNPVKDWLGAVLAFDKTLAIEPGRHGTLRERAYTHAKLAQYCMNHRALGRDPVPHLRASIADADTVLRSDGNDAAALDQRAFSRQALALRLGQGHEECRALLEGAVADARAATSVDPSDADRWHTVGLVLDTLNTLGPSLGLETGPLIREQARIADTAMTLLPEAFGPRYCRAVAECYLARMAGEGVEARRNGCRSAIERLNSALALQPDAADALMWRGAMRRELSALPGAGTPAARAELLRAARADLDRSVAADARSDRAFGERAMALHELAKLAAAGGGGEQPEALLQAATSDIAEAIRRRPDYWAYHAARMFVLQTRHDRATRGGAGGGVTRPLRDGLIESAGAVLASRPTMPDALWIRANRLRERANERIAAGNNDGIADLQGAIRDFGSLVALRPDDPRGYINRAAALRVLADIHVNNKRDATALWTQMLEDGRTAAAQAPTAWQPLALQGFALAGLGRTAEARSALQRALAINPDNAMTRAALAKLEGR
ncbi:MAG: serine/threonine-protein kinase [Planctomycetota bacterium]|jgi:tetratricopeptide (TPR) repeat protein